MKTMKKDFVNTRFFTALFVGIIMVLSAGFIGTVNATDTSGNHVTTSTLGAISLLPPPSGYGAWESINGQPWVERNVTVRFGNNSSEQSGNNFNQHDLRSYDVGGSNGFEGVQGNARPLSSNKQSLGTFNEGGSYGIEGIYGDAGVVNTAVETVEFSQYNGEYTSATPSTPPRSESWSVQMNSNFFGTNGNDWVQFVFANNNFQSGSTLDIVEWYNVHQSDNYKQYSSVVPIYALFATSFIQLSVSAGSGGLSLTLVTETPSGYYNEYYMSEPDLYGLEGNWSEISGTILGLEDSSTAVFNPTAAETTWINASAPSPWDPSYEPITVTGEQNNLNVGYITDSWYNEPGFYSYYLGVSSHI